MLTYLLYQKYCLDFSQLHIVSCCTTQPLKMTHIIQKVYGTIISYLEFAFADRSMFPSKIKSITVPVAHERRLLP